MKWANIVKGNVPHKLQVVKRYRLQAGNMYIVVRTCKRESYSQATPTLVELSHQSWPCLTSPVCQWTEKPTQWQLSPQLMVHLCSLPPLGSGCGRQCSPEGQTQPGSAEKLNLISKQGRHAWGKLKHDPDMHKLFLGTVIKYIGTDIQDMPAQLMMQVCEGLSSSALWLTFCHNNALHELNKYE